VTITGRDAVCSLHETQLKYISDLINGRILHCLQVLTQLVGSVPACMYFQNSSLKRARTWMVG